jgi:2-dehydropantoate 2-reductase
MQTPYVIFGAGAVGSAIGGYLARAGHEVVLVARETHVAAVREHGALRVTTYEEAFSVPLKAWTTLPERLPGEAVLCITVQSPDVGAAVRAVGPHARRRAVVTWQNGVRAEDTAAARCPRLYGGIVRFTATLLDPGEVRLRRPGHLIVGRHPSGVDAAAERIVADLNAAGFTAAVSPDIRTEKALKLLVNLVSGPAVLVRRTGRCPELALVQSRLLDEAEAVYAAAGIRAEPLSGLGQTLEEMQARFRSGGGAPDGRPVYNSTWQNLHHRRPRLENAFYHGEIIALGERNGIPTPLNRRVLEELEEVRERGLGPEPYSPAQFRERFDGLVDFAEAPDLEAPAPPPTLEI